MLLNLFIVINNESKKRKLFISTIAHAFQVHVLADFVSAHTFQVHVLVIFVR